MRPSLALLLALSLSGCAGLGRAPDQWRTAPDGLSLRDHALRASLVGGGFGTALARLDGRRGGPDDRLLAAMYRGVVAFYAGRLDDGARALERAHGMTEDRATKSASRAALSLFASDHVLPYVPGPTERLFIPYYGALTWLARGETDEAAVEARRLVGLLGRADGEQSQAGADVRAVLHYFAGAVFDAAGEHGDALVAYRNAAAIRGGAVATADSLAPTADSGDVAVFLERGFVDYPVETFVTGWLDDGELVALTGGSDEVRWHTARRIGGRLAAHNPRPASGRVEFFTVSWPGFRSTHADRRRLAVRVDALGERSAALVTDVSDAVRADFERGQAARVARAIVRAAARFVALREAGRRLEESGDEQGKKKAASVAVGAGLAALSLTSAAIDRADTRSWQLLPAVLGVVRLRLPAGEHEVKVVSGNEVITLGRVRVRAGAVSILAHRVWPGERASSTTVAVVTRFRVPFR